jgi:hypothetical protein
MVNMNKPKGDYGYKSKTASDVHQKLSSTMLFDFRAMERSKISL